MNTIPGVGDILAIDVAVEDINGEWKKDDVERECYKEEAEEAGFVSARSREKGRELGPVAVDAIDDNSY